MRWKSSCWEALVNEFSSYAFSPLREGDISLFRGSGIGLAPILLVAAEERSPGCVERLEHEYALKSELDADWAARPVALTHDDGRMTLVLEDPGGAPLDRLLGRPLEVSHFLRIAIPLAGALRRVHERGLIHKDIKPANILVNAASGGVWLTGFGIASRLPREHQAPAPPEVIAGTLAYMAPEQTGRMNRSVDSRSDLYALGVTFYEMLTGQLPFTAADPMEWVHCHIARQPAPPAWLFPSRKFRPSKRPPPLPPPGPVLQELGPPPPPPEGGGGWPVGGAPQRGVGREWSPHRHPLPQLGPGDGKKTAGRGAAA